MTDSREAELLEAEIAVAVLERLVVMGPGGGV
jgi:hypothetical protein